MKISRVFLVVTLILLILTANATPLEQSSKLQFVLVFSRHGVRTPLNTNAQLNLFSAEPWPEWDVPVGNLTKQGQTLMKVMGTYYRDYFVNQNLLSSKDCTDASHFYFWADALQRDIESGRAIASGMLPGCSVDVHSVAQGRDPLFAALAEGIGKADPKLGVAAISGRIGGDAADWANVYRPALQAMQDILGKAARSIFDVEASVRPTAALTQLNGPLNMAAAISENFLLEYTNGMKDADVGWGRVNKANIQSMLLLQEAYNDIALRTPYIARANGSNLMSHMFKSLQQAVNGKAVQGALGKAGDKGLFLLGHDSDLSFFGGMLGISWLLPDYQPNTRPPGSALVFEVWKDSSTGKASVRAYFISQSLDQMRNVTPLSLQAPPERAAVFIPGCSSADEGYPCDWETFQLVMEKAIDPAFVSP